MFLLDITIITKNVRTFRNRTLVLVADPSKLGLCNALLAILSNDEQKVELQLRNFGKVHTMAGKCMPHTLFRYSQDCLPIILDMLIVIRASLIYGR